jgi:hypothetical protein
VVIKCRIARIAGLKMKKELNTALIASNLYVTRVAGVLVMRGALGRKTKKRNALDCLTAASSSDYSSVRFF